MTHTTKSVVWTFGRMNPPTIGHEKVINKVLEVSKLERADAKLFLSQTSDNQDNPLLWKDKCYFAKKAFCNIDVVEDEKIRTPFEALEELCKHYKHVTMIVGEDRAESFLTRMSPYAKEWGAEFFAVVNAGKRNTNSSKLLTSASATKAREYAINNDFDNFSKIVASSLRCVDKQNLFEKVKAGLA